MRVSVTGSLPRDVRLTKADLRAAARFFATRSRARLGADEPWYEVVVHLVRDARSDALHRAIMGIAGATDVITQAYAAIPPEAPGLYGEIFVNADAARRAAPHRATWSLDHEILLYVAHGCDHLSGANDHLPQDYARMRRRELSWLRAFCAQSPRMHATKMSAIRTGAK